MLSFTGYIKLKKDSILWQTKQKQPINQRLLKNLKILKIIHICINENILNRYKESK